MKFRAAGALAARRLVKLNFLIIFTKPSTKKREGRFPASLVNTVLINKISFLRVPLCELSPHHQGVLAREPQNGNRNGTHRVLRMCHNRHFQES
jgi:hypothetical protein